MKLDPMKPRPLVNKLLFYKAVELIYFNNIK